MRLKNGIGIGEIKGTVNEDLRGICIRTSEGNYGGGVAY
jgi:hypothetical protein